MNNELPYDTGNYHDPVGAFVKTNNPAPFHCSKHHLAAYVQSIRALARLTANKRTNVMTSDNKGYHHVAIFSADVSAQFLNGT
jgi:hypothetical protein